MGWEDPNHDIIADIRNARNRMAELPSLTVEEWIGKHQFRQETTLAQVSEVRTNEDGAMEISYETVYGAMKHVVPMTAQQYGKICTTEELEMGTINRVQAEALAAQAAKALEIVNARERKFGEDIYNDGDILYADVKWLTREQCDSESTFKRQRIYKYAFIKAGNAWFSSGPRSGGVQFTWEQLVDWLNSRYIVKFGGTVKQKSRIKKNEVVSDS